MVLEVRIQGTLSKADCSPKFRWPSSHQLKAWRKQMADLPWARGNSAIGLPSDFMHNTSSSWFASRLPLDLNCKSFLCLQPTGSPNRLWTHQAFATVWARKRNLFLCVFTSYWFNFSEEPRVIQYLTLHSLICSLFTALQGDSYLFNKYK